MGWWLREAAGMLVLVLLSLRTFLIRAWVRDCRSFVVEFVKARERSSTAREDKTCVDEQTGYGCWLAMEEDVWVGEFKNVCHL